MFNTSDISNSLNTIWRFTTRLTALGVGYLLVLNNFVPSPQIQYKNQYDDDAPTNWDSIPSSWAPQVALTTLSYSLGSQGQATLMTPLSLFIGLSSFVQPINAQTTFFETLGGPADEQGQAIQITPENDTVVAGFTNSFGAGGSDVLLLKFFADGTLAWAKTLGGAGDDQGNDLALTLEGDILVGGRTDTIFGALLSKFFANGTLAWARIFGDRSYDLQLTPEGDFFVVGSAGNNVLLTKFFANGTLDWFHTLGDAAGNDVARALALTPEGDIIIGGRTENFAVGANFLLSKFFANGTLAWARVFGGTDFDSIAALQTTPQGDIIMTGQTGSFGSSFDLFLSKFFANGTLTWALTLDGTSVDRGYALQLTPGGDILVTGETRSGNADLLLAKFFSNGTLAWARAGDDSGNAMALTLEGDILVTGQTPSFGAGSQDLLLARFDANGTIDNCSAWRTITPHGAKHQFQRHGHHKQPESRDT